MAKYRVTTDAGTFEVTTDEPNAAPVPGMEKLGGQPPAAGAKPAIDALTGPSDSELFNTPSPKPGDSGPGFWHSAYNMLPHPIDAVNDWINKPNKLSQASDAAQQERLGHAPSGQPDLSIAGGPDSPGALMNAAGGPVVTAGEQAAEGNVSGAAGSLAGGYGQLAAPAAIPAIARRAPNLSRAASAGAAAAGPDVGVGSLKAGAGLATAVGAQAIPGVGHYAGYAGIYPMIRGLHQIGRGLGKGAKAASEAWPDPAPPAELPPGLARAAEPMPDYLANQASASGKAMLRSPGGVRGGGSGGGSRSQSQGMRLRIAPNPAETTEGTDTAPPPPPARSLEPPPDLGPSGVSLDDLAASQGAKKPFDKLNYADQQHIMKLKARLDTDATAKSTPPPAPAPYSGPAQGQGAIHPEHAANRTALARDAARRIYDSGASADAIAQAGNDPELWDGIAQNVDAARGSPAGVRRVKISDPDTQAEVIKQLRALEITSKLRDSLSQP